MLSLLCLIVSHGVSVLLCRSVCVSLIVSCCVCLTVSHCAYLCVCWAQFVVFGVFLGGGREFGDGGQMSSDSLAGGLSSTAGTVCLLHSTGAWGEGPGWRGSSPYLRPSM